MSKAQTPVKVRWQPEQCAAVSPLHQLLQPSHATAPEGRLLLAVARFEATEGISEGELPERS